MAGLHVGVRRSYFITILQLVSCPENSTLIYARHRSYCFDRDPVQSALFLDSNIANSIGDAQPTTLGVSRSYRAGVHMQPDNLDIMRIPWICRHSRIISAVLPHIISSLRRDIRHQLTNSSCFTANLEKPNSPIQNFIPTLYRLNTARFLNSQHLNKLP